MSDVVTAGATVAVAWALATFADQAIARRGDRMTKGVPGASSVVTKTRLRLIRRLLYATILGVGIALAMFQFEEVKRVATGLLASSAVLGLVVGFAARQTLANAVAGILLAITQPIRIGDTVTFEGDTGKVEDIRLTYTYIACEDGRRVIVPNERLASNTMHNHTLATGPVRVEVALFLPPEADALRALAVLGREEGVDVRVDEVEKDAVRIVAGTQAPSIAERGAVAAGLRVSCLERLKREGLSSAAAEGPSERHDPSPATAS